MMRLLLLSLLLVACQASFQARFNTEHDRYWEVYKIKYEKIYAKEQEILRRSTWESNLKYIQKHNLEADMGFHTFTLGINEYADWTNAEFVTYLKGYLQRNSTQHGSYFMAAENINLPTTVDWRQHGYVTGVKNQKQCGSCWAFSATGSLEGQHFKKTSKLVSLSEQNLVDCSRKQGNMGCGGGLMDNAFKYIKENNGIDTEESYPYEAKDGKCRFKKEDVGATVTGYTDIPHGDEDALQKAVATVGPISVAIDAGHQSFQLYKQGVYYEKSCSSKLLDHGVLAVGYGSGNGDDYWLVKNSWGATWGMEGYIKMSRNRDNNCGIATQASYPLV